MPTNPSPLVLYVDNGQAFTSLRFDEDANIRIRTQSPGHPRGRATVERCFHSLNQTLRYRTSMSLADLQAHIQAFIEKHNADHSS